MLLLTPFFIRLYHAKKKDKEVMERKMKKLCHLGIFKEGFSAYSSPDM